MKILRFNENNKIEDKYITTTYQTIIPGEEWDDEPEIENGWEDEEGESMIPDEYDKEEGLTVVDKSVDFLKNTKYTTMPTSSMFHVGISYETPDGEENYQTGEKIYYTCHLNGFTPTEELEIWKKMTNWEENQIKKAANKYNL